MAYVDFEINVNYEIRNEYLCIADEKNWDKIDIS